MRLLILIGLAVVLGGFADPAQAACSLDNIVVLAKAGYSKAEIEAKCNSGATVDAAKDPSAVSPELKASPRVFRDCPVCPEMVELPAGRFVMGAPASDANGSASERPQHEVSIRPFVLGKYVVTFAEWDACVADGGCNGYKPDDQGWGRGNRPVVNVNWQDATAYVAWLNIKLQQAGGIGDRPYRIPSEAEWEYAARAGTTTRFWWGEELGIDNANCDGCGGKSQNKTVPVGSFRPNPFGLYDVAGNVSQFTADCSTENYVGAPIDGSPVSGVNACKRVQRGGNYYGASGWLPSATRMQIYDADQREQSAGFRVARSAQPPANLTLVPTPPTSPGSVFRDCPDCPEMVVVPPGDFLMGSPRSDKDADGDERPRRKISIRSFALAKHPVTRGEYSAFIKETGYVPKGSCNGYDGSGPDKSVTENWEKPGFVQTDHDPVVCVSYNDSIKYIAWLYRKIAAPDNDNPYRMVTEAEWEYAARAGSTTRYWWGDNVGRNNANCEGCGSRWDNKQTAPVGSFRPNSFGLYDMAGNVSQLTEDAIDDYRIDNPADGSAIKGSVGDTGRMMRGGSWFDVPKDIRSAHRANVDNDDDAYFNVGFRLARVLP